MKAFWVGLIFCMLSCTRSKVTHNDLIQYIRDESHGLTHIVHSNNIKCEVVYQPTDAMMRAELYNDTARATIDSLRDKYSEFLYFLVRLSIDGKEIVPSSGYSYGNVIQSMSFRMDKYVSMVGENGVNIPLVDFSMNHTNGMASATEVLLVFERPADSTLEWLELILNDVGVGLGATRYKFMIDDLRKTPTIDFYQ